MLRKYLDMLTLLAVITLTTSSTVYAGVTSVPTVATQNATIFLAEILRAEPGDGCAYFHRYRQGRCTTIVRANILRVFKAADEQEPASKEFETTIQQMQVISGIGPWTDIDILPGQRYLILSRANGSFPTAFKSCLGPILITDDEDTISDLEVILASEALTISQQASSVASALTKATKPRSYFLADYSARLLAASRDFDGVPLREAIENSPDATFSPLARLSLLDRLWDEAKSDSDAPVELLHTYIVMVARYFNVEQPASETYHRDLSSEILNRHIPFLLASRQTKRMLGDAIPVALRRKIQNRAADLIARDRLDAQQVQSLGVFLRSISGQ